MRLLFQRLSFRSRFFGQRNSFHSCASLRYSSTNNHIKSDLTQNPSAKSPLPEEFSKSQAYPTRYGLHQVELEGQVKQIPRRAQIAAKLCVIGIFLVAFYAFFFSNYNLEFEELMMDTVPGHADYMKEIDPDYEKRIAMLRAARLKSEPGYDKRMEIRRTELVKATKQYDPGYEERMVKIRAERASSQESS